MAASDLELENQQNWVTATIERANKNRRFSHCQNCLLFDPISQNCTKKVLQWEKCPPHLPDTDLMSKLKALTQQNDPHYYK